MARKILGGILSIVLATAVAEARAQWPEKPIRVIVPYSAGVGGDLVMRQISEDLGKRLGQPIVVENREGASGNIGSMAAARSAADGYTFLVGQTSNFVINQHLYRSYAIDPVKAFTPITLLGTTSNVLLTSLKIPANDFRAFAEHAKANKGAINFGTTGVGTVGQLTLEGASRALDLGLTSVAYRGAGQVLTGLVSGELHVGFALPGLAVQYVQAGKVRPLAVMGTRRLASLPDTPSLGELGVDKVGGEVWWALVAPAGVPDAILTKLGAAVRQAMSNADARRRLEELGIVPVASSREEIAQRWTKEAAHWPALIKELGVSRLD